MDKRVLEDMKTRISGQGGNVNRELASVVGLAPIVTKKETNQTEKESMADHSPTKSRKGAFSARQS
jgi:hypothetical protein